jgi:hypothetical protein
MIVQKKLACFEADFWRDLPQSISWLVRDLITGRDVPRIAAKLRELGVEKCSDSLLYKWANPNEPHLPSFKAFLLLIKITENCTPVDTISPACGMAAIMVNGDPAASLRALAAALEGK